MQRWREKWKLQNAGKRQLHGLMKWLKIYRLHRNTSHRCLRSHLRAHVDLFLEFNLLRGIIVHNNAIQRAAPSSPPKYDILFVVSPAKTCVYSSKFLASCIHKLEFKFSWSKFSWMETWMQNLYRVYRDWLIDWLIAWLVFNVQRAIFQLYSGREHLKI